MEGFVRIIRGELGEHADDVLRQLDLDSYVDDVAQKGDNLADDVVGALCSFSGDTLVTTAEGLIAISALETGDYVLAYDEATGTTGFYPILATWVHEDPVMVALVIDGEVVETTPEHPFYTEEGDWVAAGELQAGDRIRQADGTTGTVEAVAFVYRLQPMYNLTVATAHTFFVGDGQWLVHNTCQIHHAISNKIKNALDSHPKLSGVFDREDDLFKFVASREEAHRGYQKWHRQYDRQVVEWLERNPGATREGFLKYLIGVYSSDDLSKRFPDAVDSLRKALHGD